jgi:hypothetical protein
MAKKKKPALAVYDEPTDQPAAAEQPAETPPDLSYIEEGIRPLAVPLTELTIDPDNCNKHDEESIDGIMGSLETYRQRRLVVVNKPTGYIEAGNGVVEAARALGWSHVAVLFVHDDAATATGYSIADNRTARLSKIDPVALKKSLAGISTKNNERLDKMIASMSTELKLFPVDEPRRRVQFNADEQPKPLELIVGPFEEESQFEDVFDRLRKEGWKCRRA